MILSVQQHQEFEALTRPLMEWLNKNFHPHVSVIVEPTSAEFLEGVCAIRTNDYVQD